MKTKVLNPVLFFLLFFYFCASLYSYAQSSRKTEWDIPAEYKTMKNPVKKSESSLALGKQQYLRVCASCHGITGKGDGEKAKNFANITPANLSLDKFHTETDGEHFYKIKIGRNNLHSFKGKIDDEAIWSVIIYMKTFK